MCLGARYAGGEGVKPVWIRDRPRHEVPPPRRWRMRLWLVVAGFIIMCFSKDEGWVAGAFLIALALILCLITPPEDRAIRKIDRHEADKERYERK